MAIMHVQHDYFDYTICGGASTALISQLDDGPVVGYVGDGPWYVGDGPVVCR